jgi:hypothetical protein
MNVMDWFYGAVPFQRKRATDWIFPACAGLGVGLAVGIGVGLLYAPAPGDEARRRLREGASRVKGRAADLASRARGQLASAVEPSRASSP